MCRIASEKPPTLSIALLLFVTLLVAVACVCYRSIPVYGIPVAIEAVALLCCIASFTGWRGLRPLSNRPWTLVEFLVVAAYCAIIHGLAMPAVSSCAR